MLIEKYVYDSENYVSMFHKKSEILAKIKIKKKKKKETNPNSNLM